MCPATFFYGQNCISFKGKESVQYMNQLYSDVIYLSYPPHHVFYVRASPTNRYVDY